jgi:hypothetical protein
MKTQKTFTTTAYDLDFVPEVGEEVVLISHENNMNDRVSFTLRQAPEGIPGNMDSSIKRFHGWRGTYNDVATYAHGLRRILKITTVDLGGDYGYKITVGPDLYPDWD